MAATLEREIKLRFDDPAQRASRRCSRPAARRCAAGGCRTTACSTPPTDSAAAPLGAARAHESGTSLLTFKGPVQPSAMKLREELETAVGDGTLMLRLLEELGFRVWFRYQKYREEFALDDVIVAVDETPVGTYVEIEGGERGIATATEALGRDAVRLPARFLPRSLRPPLPATRSADHRHDLRRRAQ